MIRFVDHNAEGLPLKRKQSQRACDTCRKRKKRCIHQPSSRYQDADSRGHGPSPQSQHSAGNTPNQSWDGNKRRRPLQTFNRPSDDRQTPAQLAESANMVSPEAAPRNSLSDETEEEDDDHYPTFVGDLNPEGMFVASMSPASAPTIGGANSPEDVVGIWVPRKLLDAAKALPGPIMPVLLPYLQAECARILPTPADFCALHRLYLEDFHPILPLISLESDQKQPEKNILLLKLALCLLMSSNLKAEKHLSKTPRDFADIAGQLLRSAIDNSMLQSKRVIMQLLIALALATQLSGDGHISAEYTGRAVTYVHTAGLQLDTSGHSDDSSMSTLFCCAFTMDRLNAAVQGRPVLMHERDFGRDVDTCIKQQGSLFQLLLRVILLLDKVIALYRPTPNNSDIIAGSARDFDWTFPAFEDLLNMCGVVRAPAALVATIETLYHAVAMLSCRSQSLSELSRGSSSHTRQSLSAASIVSIAGNEYHGQLSILPFVPYSLSLALRVSYRDLRLSKSSFTRTRARRQLLHICNLLRELGDMFSSSMRMAEMAEELVREIDRTCSNVAVQRKASLAAIAMSDPGNDESERLQATESQYRQQDLNQNGPKVTPNLNTDVTIQPRDSDIRVIESQLSLEDHDAQGFNPTLDMDFDIFDHFDPEFDIQAIDAALANSINPSLPVNMLSWDSFGH